MNLLKGSKRKAALQNISHQHDGHADSKARHLEHVGAGKHQWTPAPDTFGTQSSKRGILQPLPAVKVRLSPSIPWTEKDRVQEFSQAAAPTFGACSELCCSTVYRICMLLGFLALESSLKITNLIMVPRLSRCAFNSSLQREGQNCQSNPSLGNPHCWAHGPCLSVHRKCTASRTEKHQVCLGPAGQFPEHQPLPILITLHAPK